MGNDFESESFADMIAASEAHDFLPRPHLSEDPSLKTPECNRALQANVLIIPHLPLVRSIACRMRATLPRHVELDELVSAGLVGLVDAVRKFDPQKDTRFASYARIRIRGAIVDFLRSLDWCPRDLRRKKRFIDSTTNALTASLGRDPSDDEIATASDLSLAEYQTLLTSLVHATLTSTSVPVDPEDSTGEELPIPAPSEYDPLYQCIQNQTREHIAIAVGNLPERQRLILTLYYYEELTMREIGDLLGIAESRVSQIRSAALKSLGVTLRCR
jgi:RNA polymerase sigma factor for flagellar operon FliA